MIAEAPTATAQPDPAWSPAGAAHLPGQHWCQGNPNRGPRALRQAGADPVRDDTVVIDLVTRARHGDMQAWDLLITRVHALETPQNPALRADLYEKAVDQLADLTERCTGLTTQMLGERGLSAGTRAPAEAADP
jgi:hypothetical protein